MALNHFRYYLGSYQKERWLHIKISVKDKVAITVNTVHNNDNM